MNNPNSLVIHLDSRFATQYMENDANNLPLTTNYTYNLVEGISIPDTKVCEVSLYTATIPFSFYNVRTGVNDKFRIIYTTILEVFEDFTIPAGNYSANGLLNIFKTLQKAAADPILASFDFTIQYLRESLKFDFAMNTDVGTLTSLKINFTNCASMFGFRTNNFDYSFSGAVTNYKLGSEIAIDISDSIHGLYIRQNLASKSTLDNENGTFSNILTRIPINTNPGGIIFHSPSNSTHRALTSIHTIQTIGVKLTDDRNRAIDLNGLHWQMSLLITLVDKQSVIPELTKYTRRKNEIHQLAQQRQQIIQQKTKKKKKKRNKKSK